MADHEGAEPMVEQDHAENKSQQNSNKFKSRFANLKRPKVGKKVKRVGL